MWPFSSSSASAERQIGRAVLEARASLENPNVSLYDNTVWRQIFGSWESASGVAVTAETALGIPAVWSAVNFIAGTIAGLPTPVYRKQGTDREKDDSDPIYVLLHDWVNDEYLTSYEWRYQAMTAVLLNGGRSYTFVEGKKRGRITNLWPLESGRVAPKRVRGKKIYVYQDPNGTEKVYDPDEIIDVAFMMRPDGLGHYDPISILKDSLGLTISLDRYASRHFVNGGVPPLAMQMPAGTTPGAMSRAAQDIAEWISGANRKDSNVLPMPPNHRLEAVGIDPQKGQLIEAKQHQIRDVARLYMLPPVFLQDLQFGTFSNTEQQDLILVKHTLTRWLRRWEGELNAKLFGVRSTRFVEFNVDGLLRGDFKSRSEALSSRVQTGQLTPNEARAIENRPKSSQPEADMLHINGAVVPLGQQSKAQPASPTPPKEGSQDA